MPIIQVVLSSCDQRNIGYLSDFNHLQVNWHVISISRRPNSNMVGITICKCNQCTPSGHDEHLRCGTGFDEGASATRRYDMSRVFIDNTPIPDTIIDYNHLLDVRLIQVLPNGIYLQASM